MRRWLRIGLWMLAGLLLLVMLALGAAWSLLASHSGSRWLLDQVPGLEVQGFQGVLLDQWQAEHLHWQDGETRAQLTAVDMVLDTSCLWRGALCLQQLQVQGLDLQLPETAETEEEPATDLQLPEIHLPFSVEIDRLAVGEFYLNDELLVQDFKLAAHATADRLELSGLSLSHDVYQASLAGSLQLTGDWPLELQLDAGGDVPELGRQQLQLELNGKLQQEVRLQAKLQGALTGRLQAHARPLETDLPASLELVLERLELAHLLPEQLSVSNLQLIADGSLAQGFGWQLDSLLKASQQDFTLEARGKADPGSAVIERLRLAHAEQEYLELQARAGWQDELGATANLEISQFPWQLLAGLDEAPIAIHTGAIEFAYAGDAWQGEIEAELAGPAGDFAVASQLQGDTTQLQADPLLVTAGSGRIQGRVEAGWQDAVTWLASLEIDRLDPAYWLADLPGQLAGTLHSTGRMDDALDMAAELKLNGQLRGQPLHADLAARGKGEAWQVPQLDLRLGDNRIQGQLQLDEKLAGNLNVALPAPDQLLPGASGSLQAEVQLGGSLQQADADLQLSGSKLAYAGQRVRQLQLTGRLRQGQHGSLDLLARGLASGEDFLGRLQLKADGELAAHRLEASLSGPLANAALKLEGALEQDNVHWLGQLQELQVGVENQQWQLEQPLTIDYLHEQHARLAAHCLVSEHGRLCAEGGQQLLPQLQLDYRLREFVLASLQPWLPEGLALDGTLNGEVQLHEQAGSLQGQVQLDAGQGALRMEQEEQRFAWRALTVSADLLPEQVDTRIRLQGAQQGSLLVEARIDPRPQDKPLSGSFQLSQLNLDALHGFVQDIEQLQGRIEGQGRIAGTLLAPEVNGNLRLSDGQIGGGMLPVSLEQLQLDVRVAGQQATLVGNWHSGESGSATLDGQISWLDEPAAGIRLKGRALPVHVQPYADLEVAPDLQIGYGSRGLSVIGSLAVPKGKITVPELPPHSVSVSSDAVVVGRETQEPELNVHMDIAVDVGSERLRFSGFGLTSDVRGNLQVGDNLSGRGALELKNGRFRGYGQKLDLRRARLVFTGPLTQPYIDIEAVRVTGDVTAGLRITGLAEQPQTQIFSEPPMAQEQAMSWLLRGKPLGASEDGNMLADAMVALGMLGAEPMTGRLADSLGIEDFALESEGSGDGTSVVASGQITERLSLRYGVSIFEPGNTLGLRYQLTRRLYLDAASGLANSLDLFYRRNF